MLISYFTSCCSLLTLTLFIFSVLSFSPFSSFYEKLPRVSYSHVYPPWHGRGTVVGRGNLGLRRPWGKSIRKEPPAQFNPEERLNENLVSNETPSNHRSPSQGGISQEELLSGFSRVDDEEKNIRHNHTVVEVQQVYTLATNLITIGACTDHEFQEQSLADVDSIDVESASTIASDVTDTSDELYNAKLFERLSTENDVDNINVEMPGKQYNTLSFSDTNRPLDAPVDRWPHIDKLIADEPDGCGRPLCIILDQKPKRFKSMCQLVDHLSSNLMFKQFFHAQKGDCANAIERNGLDWVWGDASQYTSCDQCHSDEACGHPVCMAFHGRAKTYPSVCEVMRDLANRTDVVTIHIALGDCRQLLSSEDCLYTEWFDIDEPCKAGDTESMAQNLAFAATLKKSGRFRMCPSIRQIGQPEYRTVEDEPIPADQKVETNDHDRRLTCLNKEQHYKPSPPHAWFADNIKCRDYKMRQCCKCLYGCSVNERSSIIHDIYEIDLPEKSSLFGDECEWQPFVDVDTPRTDDTWDSEDRASVLKTKALMKHACGHKIYNAHAIDVRRVGDDLPWDETGEHFTKVTPFYGALCIQGNNIPFGRACSDYKVRYCCAIEKPAEWGLWSPWSDCSKSCAGGESTRNRECVMKEGEQVTCFGNFLDIDETGKDRHINLKRQVKKCNELGCPDDANFQEWMAWEPCPVTCGGGIRQGTVKRRRRRGCSPPLYGGKECPSDRSKYEDWQDCPHLKPCPQPMWTTWTHWTPCSLTCGLGRKRKSRECEDSLTQEPAIPGLDCIGGSTFIEEDCKLTDCPIGGRWTSWLNWESCNVLCGSHGTRKRRRYCANPLPQFGGVECDGDSIQRGKCLDLNPCPVNCEWSEWGKWSQCSVTCGARGEGMQTRGRHIAQQGMYGGRNCTGNSIQHKVCPHERMAKGRHVAIGDESQPIYFCPVDCVWGDWSSWSSCPECYGDYSGYYAEELAQYEQIRTRKVKTRQRYRGKRCGRSSTESEKRSEYCTTQNVEACPVDDMLPFMGPWESWSSCFGCCGKPGNRTRLRTCYNGPCDQDNGFFGDHSIVQSQPCKSFCPSLGWSEWNNWSSCAVTCGTGQRARVRHCLDDTRDETRSTATSACSGIQRQTHSCDMGRCGSRTPLLLSSGPDPLAQFIRDQ